MAKKMGRPLMGKEKKVYFNINLSEEAKKIINDAATENKTSASLLIEQLILERYKNENCSKKQTDKKHSKS